jgi:hypothetical protein
MPSNEGNIVNIPKASPFCNEDSYISKESHYQEYAVRAETAALASEKSAENSENSAVKSEISAQESEDSALRSEISAQESEDSALEAYHWAQYPINQPVPEGDGVTEFSAYHWALKASEASGKYYDNGLREIVATGDQIQIIESAFLQNFLITTNVVGGVILNQVPFDIIPFNMMSIRLIGNSTTENIRINTADIDYGAILNSHFIIKPYHFIEIQFIEELKRWIEVSRSQAFV